MAEPRQVGTTGMRSAAGTVNFYGTPDECPICHQGTDPRIVHGVIIGGFSEENSNLRIVFQCTSSQCNEAFIGYYDARHGGQGSGYNYHFQDKLAPQNPEVAQLPDSVAEVSPSFVEIYNQALGAEAFSLDQMTGIGLRKALEFLIKDFLINQDPQSADEVKGKMLGKCIDENVVDANIKATAKLATWLGNDETHYVRRWDDKDINDLKVLIRLTINWIDSVLLTQKYSRSMHP